MKSLILTLIFKLGLNKVFLKIALFTSFVATAATEAVTDDGEHAKTFLGVTIFIWLIYFCTIMLDWATGVRAGHFLARKKGKDFKWDYDKVFNNMFKHCLFLIVISAIYFFKKEIIRQGFSTTFASLLLYIQYAYFIYSFLNEWKSIEENRFIVSNKYSRIYNLISRILNIADEAAINKLEQLTNTKEDEANK